MKNHYFPYLLLIIFHTHTFCSENKGIDFKKKYPRISYTEEQIQQILVNIAITVGNALSKMLKKPKDTREFIQSFHGPYGPFSPGFFMVQQDEMQIKQTLAIKNLQNPNIRLKDSFFDLLVYSIEQEKRLLHLKEPEKSIKELKTIREENALSKILEKRKDTRESNVPLTPQYLMAQDEMGINQIPAIKNFQNPNTTLKEMAFELADRLRQQEILAYENLQKNPHLGADQKKAICRKLFQRSPIIRVEEPLEEDEESDIEDEETIGKKIESIKDLIAKKVAPFKDWISFNRFNESRDLPIQRMQVDCYKENWVFTPSLIENLRLIKNSRRPEDQSSIIKHKNFKRLFKELCRESKKRNAYRALIYSISRPLINELINDMKIFYYNIQARYAEQLTKLLKKKKRAGKLFQKAQPLETMVNQKNELYNSCHSYLENKDFQDKNDPLDDLIDAALESAENQMNDSVAINDIIFKKYLLECIKNLASYCDISDDKNGLFTDEIFKYIFENKDPEPCILLKNNNSYFIILWNSKKRTFIAILTHKTAWKNIEKKDNSYLRIEIED